MKKNNNKGFTLVEVVVVIVVLFVLAAMITPRVLNYLEKSH